ncbi:MAG: hypothetical protein ACFFD8_04115 [Candidatus Thorarchaeota archaeon]
MPKTLSFSLIDEEPKGTFRILSVEQRHERSGRTAILLDGESMGERKTDFRKRQFTYLIQGMADVEIKPSSWLLSPREDLGAILEVTKISLPKSRKKSKRLALRVQFDDTGIIRLNERWQVFINQPLTRRIVERWKKRMTDGATQYHRELLPSILNEVLFESTNGIHSMQVNQIRSLQDRILRRAIQLAISQEALQITSTQLTRATREVLNSLNKG